MGPKAAPAGDTSDEEEPALEEGDAADDGGDSDGGPDGRLERRLVAAQAKERLAALSDRCRVLTAENEKLTEEVTEARSSLQDIRWAAHAQRRFKASAALLLRLCTSSVARSGRAESCGAIKAGAGKSVCYDDVTKPSPLGSPPHS